MLIALGVLAITSLAVVMIILNVIADRILVEEKVYARFLRLKAEIDRQGDNW